MRVIHTGRSEGHRSRHDITNDGVPVSLRDVENDEDANAATILKGAVNMAANVMLTPVEMASQAVSSGVNVVKKPFLQNEDLPSDADPSVSVLLPPLGPFPVVLLRFIPEMFEFSPSQIRRHHSPEVASAASPPHGPPRRQIQTRR